MNEYLIPANTKRGNLILGIFKPFDFWIFIIGASITLLSLLIFSNALSNSIVVSLLCITPALVAAFLCLPLPYYYNVRTFIVEMWNYFTTNQRLVWRGWCYKDGGKKE